MGKQDIIISLEKKENELINIAADIKSIFFNNERYFDGVHRFDRLGLDNPPYSYGSQGELSYSYDTEKWQEFTNGRGVPFETELQDTFKWFNTLKYYAECEGYGIGAAARGFDVTRPIGLLWNESVKAIRVLRDMAQIANVKLNEGDRY
jgi:hypothetical protein